MNRSKKKGTAFESLVVARLRMAGFAACERRAGYGTKDRGDVAGVPGWAIECKAEKSITLAAYCDEAAAEATNAAADHQCVIVKRPRAGIGRAYVVMELDDWCALVGNG